MANALRLARLAAALQRLSLIDRIEFMQRQKALQEAQALCDLSLQLVLDFEAMDRAWLMARLGVNRKADEGLELARVTAAEQERKSKQLSSDCARVEKLHADAHCKVQRAREAEALTTIVESFVARTKSSAQA